MSGTTVCLGPAFCLWVFGASVKCLVFTWAFLMPLQLVLLAGPISVAATAGRRAKGCRYHGQIGQGGCGRDGLY